MRTSHRYQFRLPVALASDLETYAKHRGLGLSPTIRLLLAWALEATRERSVAHESALALGTLIAAEHAVLMVASVLPEGQRRMHELGQQAAVAAEERLALVRESST